jgi:hypothetical protein
MRFVARESNRRVNGEIKNTADETSEQYHSQNRAAPPGRQRLEVSRGCIHAAAMLL